MTILLYCVGYAGAMVFLAGCLARALWYARQPVHLRWEIYPVPHGRPAELKIMLPEILFLKGLWEFNRRMWYVSYPFHLGLYLVGLAVALALAVPPAAGVAGAAGLVLVLVGSLGILVRRLSSRELRIYTTSCDLLHLAWFAATSALLLAGSLWRPEGTAGPLAILRGAATFDAALRPPPLLAFGALSGTLLLAYIPMTHMSHFIAKYFTYHAVRWDERAAAGLRRRMAEYLTYRPDWSAPHVGADGQRTWAEIAAANPAKGGGK